MSDLWDEPTRMRAKVAHTLTLISLCTCADGVLRVAALELAVRTRHRPHRRVGVLFDHAARRLAFATAPLGVPGAASKWAHSPAPPQQSS